MAYNNIAPYKIFTLLPDDQGSFAISDGFKAGTAFSVGATEFINPSIPLEGIKKSTWKGVTPSVKIAPLFVNRECTIRPAGFTDVITGSTAIGNDEALRITIDGTKIQQGCVGFSIAVLVGTKWRVVHRLLDPGYTRTYSSGAINYSSLAGTVTTSSGSPTVSGTGTDFTVLQVGSKIKTAGGNEYTVLTVGSATSITLTANVTSAETGVAYEGSKKGIVPATVYEDAIFDLRYQPLAQDSLEFDALSATINGSPLSTDLIYPARSAQIPARLGDGGNSVKLDNTSYEVKGNQQITKHKDSSAATFMMNVQACDQAISREFFSYVVNANNNFRPSIPIDIDGQTTINMPAGKMYRTFIPLVKMETLESAEFKNAINEGAAVDISLTIASNPFLAPDQVIEGIFNVGDY